MQSDVNRVRDSVIDALRQVAAAEGNIEPQMLVAGLFAGNIHVMRSILSAMPMEARSVWLDSLIKGLSETGTHRPLYH